MTDPSALLPFVGKNRPFDAAWNPLAGDPAPSTDARGPCDPPNVLVLADLFAPEVPPDDRDRALRAMTRTPGVRFHVATAHAKAMHEALSGQEHAAHNLSVGVIVSDHDSAERDIPYLLAIPGHDRFAAVLQGPDRIDLTDLDDHMNESPTHAEDGDEDGGYPPTEDESSSWAIDALSGYRWLRWYEPDDYDGGRLHAVLCLHDPTPEARREARELKTTCEDKNVPCHVLRDPRTAAKERAAA